MSHPIRLEWLRLALPALAAAGGLTLLVSRIARLRALLREERPAEPSPAPHFGDGTRDVVDEASWESFPASDPPAW